MLSNLASYLLGFASTAGPEEQENIRVTAVEAEDEDWLVVDAVPGSGPRSRSSSLDSQVEESWFVTPPPCFTSVGPVSVETSPLENLLIEHPSMSVYRRVRRGTGEAAEAPGEASEPTSRRHHRQQPVIRVQLAGSGPRSHSSSLDSQVEESWFVTPGESIEPATAPATNRRHHRQQQLQQARPPLRPAHVNTPAALAQAKQASLVKRAQKAQIVKENQVAKPKYVERGNKTREFNKRNKKLRRADRQQHLSGANNNRKCC